MKSAGKARSNGLYRHIRTSKEIIRNLLNYYDEKLEFLKLLPFYKLAAAFCLYILIDLLTWKQVSGIIHLFPEKQEGRIK